MHKKQTALLIFLAFFILVVGAAVYAFLNFRNAEPVVDGAPDPDWKAYVNEALGYTTLYPTAFAVNSNHTYEALGPGTAISGVSFTVPESLTRGTNLSDDSYFSIESLASTTECTASLFLGEGATESTVTEAGVRYSAGRRTGAAAGNIYEEHVYAIVGSSPCVATRYFIHSSNIENYEPGAVIEFNRGSLISVFDTIRQSISFQALKPT